MRAFGQKVLDTVGQKSNMQQLWNEMGYVTGNGRDMTSVMHRMDGPPIHEQTLGSADAMLLRLLDGDESMGGTKKPYDPRIHFVLIRDAYLDANPNNKELELVKSPNLIGVQNLNDFQDGYKKLKNTIMPWGK